MTNRLMLLDTASLYFRAFYGIPDTAKAPNGISVNAARGLLDFIAKFVSSYRPAQLIACWDDDWRPQWRVDLIPSYKAHRVVEEIENGPDIEEVPDPLEQQLPLIRDALHALRIPIIGATSHEADDVIGTLSARSARPVDIVTGDRDLFQLIDDERDIRVIYTAGGMNKLEIITAETILTRYGIHPGQYADFATLRGDASDGLPGVKGIGEKTAAALLRTHNDLKHLREAAETDTGMTATNARRLREASSYLDVAPAVVRVAKDLDIDLPDDDLRPLTASEATAADSLAAQWNITAAMGRAVTALASPA